MVGDSQCYWDLASPLKRGIFVVKASAAGRAEWSLNLGDQGYNYGKFAVELRDGTFLIAGVKTVQNKKSKKGYAESRYLARISSAGQLAMEYVFPNVAPETGTGDGFMCATETSDDGTIIATGWIKGDLSGDQDQPMFIIWGTPFAMKIILTSNFSHSSIVFDKDRTVWE